MAERAQVSIEKPEAKRENKASQKQKKGPSQSISSPVEQILFLQRTIGNQAVGRLLKSGALQPKLRIGQPGDIYEQEADRVAEQVMRIPEPQVSKETKVSSHIQNNPIQRRCPGCVKGTQPNREEEEKTLQMQEAARSTPEATPELESHISTIRGGGQPLPESVRAFFEPRFGHDFSGVRVHTDAKAAEAARELNAKAFTVGGDIVFGAGQYAPVGTIGRKLLAHELTHIMQQNSFAFYRTTVQCKIKMRRPNKWWEFGAHWREITHRERDDFLKRRFSAGPMYQFAKLIIEDMDSSADDFKFDNEDELFTEIFKRIRTSQLMRETQKDLGALGKAFGYPDSSCDARVNKAALKYWGPKQDNYYFELSDEGKKNGYEAIRTLFTPQVRKCDRTLIHCDYLASVVHFRVFAETIGIKEFNDRVKSDTIPIVLKWNGFDDIESKFLRSSKRESLQEVRPSSEKDMVIGDHVIFWNHRAYDLINTKIREAWRLENAVLIDKQKNQEDIFLGHGSGKHTDRGMRIELMKRYNKVAEKALEIIKRTKSKDVKIRDTALNEMDTKFPFVKQVGTEWRIQGAAHSKEFNQKLEPLKNEYDSDLIGLRDPDDPKKMNKVKRPIESA
jgi:hypothetical protein